MDLERLVQFYINLHVEKVKMYKFTQLTKEEYITKRFQTVGQMLFNTKTSGLEDFLGIFGHIFKENLNTGFEIKHI